MSAVQSLPGLLEPVGPTRLTGGPGSGKTAALVQLVARELKLGAAPSRVIVVVPSRAAARDFTRQLDGGGRGAIRTPLVMTHERLARWVLERSVAEPELVLGPVAEWIAMREAVERSRPVLGELGRLADVPGFVDGLLDLCGSFSQALVPPALLASRVRASSGILAQVTVLAANYQLALNRMGAIDTKQLAGVALDCIAANSAEWTGYADLLVVDQAEELSPAQWYLLRELADHLTAPNRFVVAGDATVAGAERHGPSVRCFEEFFPREMHPREFVLAASGPAVELARRWGIAAEAGPPPAEVAARAPSVRIWRAADETDEAYAVAREVLRLRLEEGVPYDQMAVVSAGGSVQLPSLVQALRSIGVPVRLEMSPWSGSPVFSQLSAWLDALCHPADDERVLAAVQGGHGGASEVDSLRLRRWAARRRISVASALRSSEVGPPGGALALRRRLWVRLGGGDPGLADQRLTLREFLGVLGALEVELGLSDLALHEFASASALARINLAIQDAGGTRELLSLGPAPLREWAQVLQLAARRSGWEVDRVPRPDRPEVTVVTLGQAKGRRWQRVFLVGVADRYLPGQGAARELLTGDDRQRLADLVPEMEEVLGPGDRSIQVQRRFLMGISRADVQLTVTWAARYGEDEVEGSRFAAALESVGVAAGPAPLQRSVTRADCVAQLAAVTERTEDGADPALPRQALDLADLLRPWDPTAAGPVVDQVHLSATSLKSWLACPRQYHYHRLRLFEATTVAAVLGTQAHRLLQLLYEDPAGWGRDPDQFRNLGRMLIQERLMPDVREWLCDPLSAASVGLSLHVMLYRWADRIVGEGPRVVGSPIALEVPFTLQRQGYLLAGRVDALWRHPSGDLELVDFKTTREVPGSARLASYVSGVEGKPALDWQLPIYELAASSGALDSATQGVRPRFVRNWYLAVEPSSKFRTGLVVRGFSVGEESEHAAWHDALLTPHLRRHFGERLDLEARSIRRGIYPAAPRHDEGTCLGERGCPFATCCDGEGSVGPGPASLS